MPDNLSGHHRQRMRIEKSSTVLVLDVGVLIVLDTL